MKKHLSFSGKSFDELEHFVNADGLHLRCQHWPVEQEPPRFLTHLMHGFGSHSGRFEEAASKLNSIGGHVFSHDQVGHGESEGERANVTDFNIYVRDSLQFIKATSDKFPGVPVFVMGQSMGAALALVVADENPTVVNGVILLAGMLGPDPRVTPMKKALLQMASYFLPRLTIVTMTDDNCSTLKEENESAENDPLKISVIKTRMLVQLTSLAQKALSLHATFEVPFIAMHGTADTTCDPALSKSLYDNSPATDKTFKLYQQCKHDLIHEALADRTKCYQDIFTWIEARIS